MIDSATVRHDIQAGVTVALMAIPQCMAFATMAGLPPAMGLHAAIVMVFIGALISASSHAMIGPNVATSPMVLAVLATVWPGELQQWPATAGVLAVLVGGFSIVAAMLRVGQFVRFVSQSVLTGLMIGAAILMAGSQIAPLLGEPPARSPTLAGIVWELVKNWQQPNVAAVAMTLGTLLFMVLGMRLGPKFPAGAVALLAGGVAAWALSRWGWPVELATIGNVPRELPSFRVPSYDGTHVSDLLVGAAAITMVNIVQTVAITRAFAVRKRSSIRAQREVVALGVANLSSGFLGGFPGAASFSRAALNELAGGRTRLSNVVCAAAIALFMFAAAPWVGQISKAAIAGLLIVTAASMINWRELREILVRGGADRLVLATTVVGVLIVPLHWAILIGLAVSIAIFLRRVSQLHLVEMVAGEDRHFQEHALDAQTGASAITMLQIEGPLFFAHADDLARKIEKVLARGPRVTIVRMRRTQQIDFSVIAALNAVAADYIARGGRIILCGLSPGLHAILSKSALGQTIEPQYMFQTTRTVFGSAHQAIRVAESLLDGSAGDDPAKRFRTAEHV